MDPILDLKQFLTFLSLGGAAVATQTLISILLEKAAWFQALTPSARLGVTVSISIALGLGATATLAFTPAETLTALQPYFLSVVLSVAPFIGGELAHRFLKRQPVTTVTTTSLKPVSTSTTVSTDQPAQPAV